MILFLMMIFFFLTKAKTNQLLCNSTNNIISHNNNNTCYELFDDQNHNYCNGIDGIDRYLLSFYGKDDEKMILKDVFEINELCDDNDDEKMKWVLIGLRKNWNETEKRYSNEKEMMYWMDGEDMMMMNMTYIDNVLKEMMYLDDQKGCFQVKCVKNITDGNSLKMIWNDTSCNISQNTQYICQYKLPYCFGLISNDYNKVCSQHGVCMGNNKCICEEKYVGRECNIPTCDNIPSNNSSVCSGNGNCSGYPDNCVCFTGYKGDTCNEIDKSNSATSTIVALVTLFIIFFTIVIVVVVVLFVLFKMKMKLDTIKKAIVRLSNAIELGRRDDDNKESVFVNFESILNQDSTYLGESNLGFKIYLSTYQDYPVIVKILEKPIPDYEKENTDIPLLDMGEDGILIDFSKEIRDNIQQLADLQHKNIVYLFASAVDESGGVFKVGLVEQFCPNYSVQKFLKHRRSSTGMSFPFDKKLDWIEDLCKALQYIHSEGYVYGELSCSNVLIDKKGCAKLRNEFILKKSLFSKEGFMKRLSRRFSKINYYIDPQIVNEKIKKNESQKIDVFNFGFVVYEILTENFDPFGRRRRSAIRRDIAKDGTFRPDLNVSSIPHFLKVIIESCWDEDEEKRLNFKEIGNILIEESSKSIMIVYIKDNETENDDDADDHILYKQTLDGLKEIIVEKYDLNKSSKYIMFDSDRKEIKTNEDFEKQVTPDSLITVQIIKK